MKKPFILTFLIWPFLIVFSTYAEQGFDSIVPNPAPGLEDLRTPVTSVKTGGSKDPDFAKILDNGAGSQGVFAYLFDATTEEEIYFAVQMPHGWREGTNITPPCPLGSGGCHCRERRLGS